MHLLIDSCKYVVSCSYSCAHRYKSLIDAVGLQLARQHISSISDQSIRIKFYHLAKFAFLHFSSETRSVLATNSADTII